jgi:hypothetical protein
LINYWTAQIKRTAPAELKKLRRWYGSLLSAIRIRLLPLSLIVTAICLLLLFFSTSFCPAFADTLTHQLIHPSSVIFFFFQKKLEYFGLCIILWEYFPTIKRFGVCSFITHVMGWVDVLHYKSLLFRGKKLSWTKIFNFPRQQ